MYIAGLCGMAEDHARIDLCSGDRTMADGLTEARIQCATEEKDKYVATVSFMLNEVSC